MRITATWNAAGHVSTQVETEGTPTAERILQALATIQDASRRAAGAVVDEVRRDVGDAAGDALSAAWQRACDACNADRPRRAARQPGVGPAPQSGAA